MVSGLLDAASALRPGDVLQRVQPVNPLAIDYAGYEARAEAEREDYLARRDAGEPVPVFFRGTYDGAADVAPLETNSLASYGAEVHTLEDIRGYSLSWTGLDLLVDRGGEPLALRHEVGKPHLIPQRLWHPDWTRRQGFTAIRVDTLPPYLRPRIAPGERHDADLLVTWVAEQSPLALQGLRPLAVIRLHGDGVDDLLDGPALVQLPGRIDAAVQVDFTPPGDPTDLTLGWVVADIESDPIRTTWSLAAGYLFQYSSAYAYNPRRDDYVQSWACTIGSTAINVSGVWDSNQTRTSTMALVLGSNHIETEVDQGDLFTTPFAFAWDGTPEDLDQD